MSDAKNIMWHDIHQADPFLYIYAHEIVHAWVADNLGATHICIRVWREGDRVKGVCKFDGELSPVHQAMVVAAPAVFFLGKTIDDYLITERAKAYELLADSLGYRLSLGEFVSAVSRPLRGGLLPTDDQLLALARRFREKDEFLFARS